MRDPARIEPLLELVAKAWSIEPDLRLGQLITIAAVRGGWTDGADVFSAEDRFIERGLHAMVERSSQRYTESPAPENE